MNLIVGSAIIYIVQLVDDMICTKVLIEKVSCIRLVGLLWVLYNCNMYYVCVSYACLGCTYRDTEWTKTYISPCFDCLCSCYIDPVQNTKVND